MPASLLWFHDHGLGATRLNVVAGLAAAYILRDEFDTGAEPNPIGIPGGPYEIPLVVQDRQFNPDGTFLYPTSNIPGAVWIGEYFGDVMLVNGKVWPFEPRLYRFRVLNGCNARILNLDIGGARMWQIGAEGGLWDKPVRVTQLVLAPAERADVLVDFSRLAGAMLRLTTLKPPKPVSTPAPPLTQVMQIRVGKTVSQPGPTSIPTSLPGRAANLPGPVATTRYITLNEIAAETVNWVLLLNGADFEDPTTETPQVGTTEDWVYINLTGDTHPMHTHLVTFQVVGRTPFDADAYQATYGGPNGVPGGIDPTPFATGPMLPPDPTERGFKDTVKANPRYFTTVRAQYDLPNGVTTPQTYVYHCHILEHEDNDMMRGHSRSQPDATSRTANWRQPSERLHRSPVAACVLAGSPESAPTRSGKPRKKRVADQRGAECLSQPLHDPGDHPPRTQASPARTTGIAFGNWNENTSRQRYSRAPSATVPPRPSAASRSSTPGVADRVPGDVLSILRSPAT
jgi:spore coat protein A